MNSMLNERINELKGTFHSLWERMNNTEDETSADESLDLDYERNYEDDMPLTLAREDGPGVRYASFGEDDSV